MCIELKINIDDTPKSHKFNTNEVRSMIFTQISNQVTQMVQCKIVHNEVARNMEFLIGGEVYELDVGKVLGDGSCLFRAASHHIFGEKLNGKLQNKRVEHLRKSVVKYIQDKYNNFVIDVQGRLFDEMKDIDDSKCRKFVDEILPQKNTWGGSETIKAIGLMHKVNILVFNEYGNLFYGNGFNDSYDKTILLAYISDMSSGQLIRNHYDSIISIDENTMFMIAKYLSKFYSQPKCVSLDDSI